MTLPTPPISAVLQEALSRSGSGSLATRSPRQWKPASIASMPRLRPRRRPPGTSRTGWRSSTTRPATGCSSTASTRVVRLIGLARPLHDGGQDAVGLALARRAGRRRRAAAQSCRSRPGLLVEPARRCRPAARRCRRGAPRPRSPPAGRVRATSFSMSISMPRLRAMSIMLSDSITGRPTLLQLEHEPQREAQVGGVGDADDQVGDDVALRAAQHDVARDLLVRASGRAANRCRAGRRPAPCGRPASSAGRPSSRR